jgi:gluconolactonase
VAQSDPKAAIWKKFPVKEDGTLGEGKVFFDSTEWVGKQKGLPDGMDIDVAGNVWATGPGGVIVFSPEGKLLGKLLTGEATANCTFANDGTLYITADMYLCRVKTNTKGAHVK